MRVRDVVEGEDAEAETEKEVCAEGDKGPEGELQNRELDRCSNEIQ